MELNRKQFLGTAAAALIGAGVTGTSVALAEEAGQEAWNAEADLVVLGSGCSGMYAACLAADAGMSVILLEKASEQTAGGDTRCCYAVFGGAASSAESLMGTISFGECDEEWARKIEEESAKAAEWVIENGCTWFNDTPDGIIEGHGPALYEAMRVATVGRGIEVRYETPAKSLIQNAEGEVVGVVAENNGEMLRIKAKRAVLIATGAYTCNKQLLWDFNHPGVDMYSLSSPHLTGDGLLMGAKIGARISKVSMGLEFHNYVAKAASDAVGRGLMMVDPPVASRIFVNGDGKRFQDEYMALVHSKTTMPVLSFSGNYTDVLAGAARYENLPMWDIFDQACFESGPVAKVPVPMTWAVCVPEDGYAWSDDNSAELDAGWIVKTDTLEELAGLIGVDPESLQATVDSYNEGCNAQDDAFGRDASTLVPIGDGPYYAVEMGVSLLYTLGGLTTDACGRTVDWDDQPISRLYSAGNVGNVGTYLAPLAVRGNMAQSAIAVQDIEGLAPWDEA